MSTKNLKKDSFLVFVLSVISKVFAIIRDSLLLTFLGTGALSDAFSLSIKLSTSLRKSFSEGALTSGLLPYLKDLEQSKNPKRIQIFIFSVFMIFVLFLSLFLSLEICFRAKVLNYIAPGFKNDQIMYYSKFATLSMITSFSYLSYSFFGVILQYQGQFCWSGIGIIIQNVSMILLMLLAYYYQLKTTCIIYIYFIATMLSMIAVLVPWVHYSGLELPRSKKSFFSLFFVLFIITMSIISSIFQVLSCISLFVLFVFFLVNKAKKNDIYLSDLRCFFCLFLPILLASFCNQANDIILMSFASLFGKGSVTILSRSSKVLQIPLTFLIPVMGTLFAYLNKSSEKQSQYLKKLSLLYTTIGSIISSIFIYLFAEFLIKIIFFNAVTSKDLVQMVPLLRLYVLALPAILLSRLMQMFFFVEKRVFFTAFMNILYTILYIVIIKISVSYYAQLSAVVLPFVICTWVNMLIFLGVGIYKKII